MAALAHPSRKTTLTGPCSSRLTKAPIFSLAQLAARRVVNGWTVQVMNKKAIIEPFVGMASLVCLASGPARDYGKIGLRVAAVRRTKVGYSPIQRQDKMALSAP